CRTERDRNRRRAIEPLHARARRTDLAVDRASHVGRFRLVGEIGGSRGGGGGDRGLVDAEDVVERAVRRRRLLRFGGRGLRRSGVRRRWRRWVVHHRRRFRRRLGVEGRRGERRGRADRWRDRHHLIALAFGRGAGRGGCGRHGGGRRRRSFSGLVFELLV